MWTKINDFRDDAVVQGPTWELILDEDEDEVIFEDELLSLPEEAIVVWQSGGRWLCR